MNLKSYSSNIFCFFVAFAAVVSLDLFLMPTYDCEGTEDDVTEDDRVNPLIQHPI